MSFDLQPIEEVLYPEIEAHSTGMLEVSELHTIAWERAGNPEGVPVIVIHGGPGGGSQPSYRQYFDSSAYDIIQFDQRGCGRSTPHAELEDNNTQAAVADIEALREHLGIETWHVCGG
jgi:proline iminopeptidase